MRVIQTRETSPTCVQSNRACTFMTVSTCCVTPDFRPLVNQWLHCGERRLSESCCFCSKVDSPFVCFYERVEYENDLSTLVRCFDARPLHEFQLSLVALHRSFSHVYSAECSNYWVPDCWASSTSSYLGNICRVAKRRIARNSAITSSESCIETSRWWGEWEGSRLLLWSNDPVLAYYHGYILKHHLC